MKTIKSNFNFCIGTKQMEYVIIEQKYRFKVLFTLPEENAEDTRIIRMDFDNDDKTLPSEDVKIKHFEYSENKYIFVKYYDKCPEGRDYETSLQQIEDQLWEEYKSWNYGVVQCVLPSAFYKDVKLSELSEYECYVDAVFLVPAIHKDYVELVDKNKHFYISLEQFKMCFKNKEKEEE